MASFQLLDQQDEDKLHRTRLLAVEEKQFKRITKRLVSPGSLISTPTPLPPTPPPDSASGDEITTAQEAFQQKQLDDWRQFREDVLLDFAAFDSSIVRIQFLYNSNEAERDRYRAEKEQIINKAQEVRENTVQLRIQLESARQTMEQRKKFDELAERITNNRLLRPREDQEVNLRKLEEECRELERESETYSATWKERREQFGRIVEEGMQLRRLIRDEKEEVERREGMDGGEEDGEVNDTGSRGGATPRHGSLSGGLTPRPENVPTPKPDGGSTPRCRSSSVGPSVRHNSPERRHEGLKPRSLAAGSLVDSLAGSRAGSRSGSRTSSPAHFQRDIEEHDGEDIAMVDSSKLEANVQATGPAGNSLGAANVSLGEGQMASDDRMDTT